MFTRARLPGFWTFNSTVSPAEFAHLDNYAYAIDGQNAGTYAPSALLTIGGSGLTVNGPFNASDAKIISVDTSLVIELTASMQLIGSQFVNTGGLINVATGAFLTVANGGVFTMSAGSTANIAATTTVTGSTTISGALTINNNATLNSPFGILYDAARTFDGGCVGPYNVDPLIWQPETAAPFSWPVRAEQLAPSTPTDPTDLLVYEAKLPRNATLVTVTVWVEPIGSHVGLPAIKPSIVVYLYDSSSGTTTLVGSANFVAGSLPAYEIRKQLLVTCPPATLVSATDRVLIYVCGEGGANYLDGLLVDTPQTTFTVDELPLA